MNIYFTEKNINEYTQCVKDIVNTNWWSEGKYIKLFEETCEQYYDMHSIAVTNGGAALYLLYKYANVKGKDVIVPGNTFYATAAAAKMAGANVIYADCNKKDLCISYDDMIKKVTEKTAAITVVHIGGHIAFEIEKIAKFCKDKKIALIEDCAHAHGAEWNQKRAGSWGIGGAYSFYATKTLTTGEGGMIVTKDNDLAEWCRLQRNYGKKIIDGKVTYQCKDGFNYRMSEFTAALGCIQMKNLDVILEKKRALAEKYNKIFKNRVTFPDGMKSGYYKYIIFKQQLKIETGKVFDLENQSSFIDDKSEELNKCIWVGKNHFCPPIYSDWEHAEKSCDEIAELLINERSNNEIYRCLSTK